MPARMRAGSLSQACPAVSRTMLSAAACLLLAAGYAPKYAARSLDDAGMRQVRAALDRLLRAHEPNPGLVLDRQWNVVLANRPAMALAGLLPPDLVQPGFNVFRASLHPQGLAAVTGS